MKRILGLEHRANGVYGYQEKDGTYIAIVRTPNEIVKNITIYFDDPYNWPRDKEGKYNGWQCRYVEKASKIESDDTYTFWTFRLKSKEARFKYFFKIDTNEKSFAYYEAGFQEWVEPDKFNYHPVSFTWNYSSEGKYIAPPKWWTETNWYQVFPDRFFSSEKELEIIKEDQHQLVGGNLKGITDKLDYIKDLGFNGVYLNPIFLAMSGHKYDTIDYFTIDPAFGTIEDFENLVKELKKRNMRIMLDGVFNHTGSEHPHFKDVLQNGANSKYKDWFVLWDIDGMKDPKTITFEEFHENKTYSTFGDTPFMPRLNWANPEVSEYICNVIKFWTEKGIDAWRMDVADEVSFDMWRKVRTTARAINPEIALLGEVWYDSMPFLNGDQFDSSMNYPFRNNILDLLIKKVITPQEYVEKVIETKYKYSHEINKGLFNLVGSHDTDRISITAKGSAREARFALAMLMLMPGVISFYYGDEIDLNHDNKEINRGVFEWNKQRGNSFEVVQSLLKYRNANIESIQGNVIYDADGDSVIMKLPNEDKVTFDFKNDKVQIESKNGNISIDIKGEWNE